MIRTILSLSVRFAQLGGMAGTAVFLIQGEFIKALQCTIVAGLCIVLLALAMKVGRPRGGKPPR